MARALRISPSSTREIRAAMRWRPGEASAPGPIDVALTAPRGGATQSPEPESEKDEPDWPSFTKAHWYQPAGCEALGPCRVSRSTPNALLLRSWLFGLTVPGGSWFRPPVPTTHSRTPLAGAAPELGFWGAKRSYWWSCPFRTMSV